MARLTKAAVLVAVSGLVLASCGDDDGGESGAAGASGGTLHVYSSLPLQGAMRQQGLDMVNGIKLALKQHGGRAGEFEVEYTSLDDATPQAGSWTPEQTSANARKAAQDDAAVAYIGEWNSGASAVSIPVLNEASLGQISPGNTAVGLTADAPGAESGEPDKYYPTGSRNYLRVVPKDTVQGAAIASLMKRDGCASAYVLNDKEVYGAGLSKNVEVAAKEHGIELLGNDGIDPKAPNYRALAEKIAAAGPDCFLYSGITANNAVQLYKDVAQALPDARLYGPDGVAESGFVDPKEGGMPAAVARRVRVTIPTLSPDEYPPEAKEFYAAFEREYDNDNPNPYAIYAYEAMDLALDTIEQLGDDGSDRQAVIDALFATEDRASVLGTYSFDENGDTTLTDYGVYKVVDGELVFDETIKAQT